MTLILQSLLKFLYFFADRQFCFIINLNLIKQLLFLGCRRQFSNCIRKNVRKKLNRSSNFTNCRESARQKMIQ